ncbi:MAG: hypothetical protein GY722_04970, partial [bacterium]|nr:hypothetical protein [bacterium]
MTTPARILLTSLAVALLLTSCGSGDTAETTTTGADNTAASAVDADTET